MHDLVALCEGEFERGILRLFQAAKTLPNSFLAPTPVIGGVFFPDGDFSVLVPIVARALVAREQFRQDAPAWAPELPLRGEDCEKLEADDNPRLSLVGLFASSLRLADWDEGHPRFATYASGLMAYRHTPVHIRRGLQQEFPPAKLRGLCDGQLYWRTPAKIAFDRDMEVRGAALEAWQAAERMGA